MRRALKIIIIFSIVFSSCTNNHPSIIRLIDLDEWESVTVDAIIKKTRLDTIVFRKTYYSVSSSEYIDSICTFENMLRHDISLRKKILEELREKPIFEAADYIYIEESEGYNHAGHFRDFVVYQQYGTKYVYAYDANKDSFEVKKYDNGEENYPGDTILHEVENHSYSDMLIVTCIKKNRNNKLTYSIQHAYFK